MRNTFFNDFGNVNLEDRKGGGKKTLRWIDVSRLLWGFDADVYLFG
jgi:hypothetical protein